MRTHAFLSGAVLVVVATLAAQDQRHIYTFEGDAAAGLLGGALAAADINGDGYDEIFAGAAGKHGNAGEIIGYSGRNGMVFWRLKGDARGDRLGYSLAVADVTGDGVKDLIAGAPGASISGGKVKVIDVKNDKVLKTLTGTGQFGFAVSGGDDVTTDGKEEFVVGAPFGSSQRRGEAFLYDGATLTPRFSRRGSYADQNLGYSVWGPGKIRGFGNSSYLVSSPGFPWGNFSLRHGASEAYDVGTGRLQVRYRGQKAGDRLGYFTTVLPDLNKDGSKEVFASAPFAPAAFNDNPGHWLVFDGDSSFSTVLHRHNGRGNGDAPGLGCLTYTELKARIAVSSGGANGSGRVEIRDPTTKGWKVMAEFVGKVAGDALGIRLARCKANEDDEVDLVIGSPGVDSTVGNDAGQIRVLSNEGLAFMLEDHKIEIANVPPVIGHLEDPAHPNQLFVMLGSLGTKPGIQLPNGLLPLNPDPYFLATLSAGFFAPTIGVFDGKGEADVTFQLPKGLPANLAGLTLHHSFITVTPTFQIFPHLVAPPITLVR